MGSAGHAFLAHTKALSPASSVRDGGWGDPPHPLEVRPGQRYWPRAGRRKRVFVVKRVSGESVVVQRLDGAEERARVTRARLLAVREDGQGRHYAFGGWTPRRCATHAAVVAAQGEEAVLVVPEWHPARPVRLPVRQLPFDGRTVGTWLRADADLAAPSAPRLGLSGLAVVADPGPERVHRPAWVPPEEPREAAARPASGRDCGDLVVHLPAREAAAWGTAASGATRDLVVPPQRPPEVHESGPTPRLEPGARVYLASEGALIGYVTVVSQRRYPGGGDIVTARTELHPAEPVESFAPFLNWRWRWWPR